MSTNRESLIKIANLVRAALAPQAYIPALTHIRFDGERATAYNDIAAISVRCDLDVQRLIPGETLIRALGSFNGETIILQEDSDGAVVLKSGRSKVKLPTLALEKFPLELPDAKRAPEVELTEDVLKGIQRCLFSVSNDPTHPALMGVTLDISDEGYAVLYSTDNFTISRYRTGTKIELPGDAPIILPTFFCEQVLKLAAAFPDSEPVLRLHSGALLAEFGKNATLFSKTLVDLEPLQFPKIIRKHCDPERLELSEIPAGFDEAVERALLVLSAETDRATKIIPGDGVFLMASSSPQGDSDDRFTFDSADVAPFSIDPAHLGRAARVCTSMVFLPRVLVMADADQTFIHLISHVATKNSEK